MGIQRIGIRRIGPRRAIGIAGAEAIVINPPTDLQAAIIPTGVRITWTDSTTTGTQTELWASVDEGAFALLDTINEGVQTYDDARDPGVTMHYKARAVK